jgi:hypothetical protein
MIGRMNDPQTHKWLALTTALDRAMQEHAPGWTDHSGHDPGVIMAFQLEELQLRVDGAERVAVSRVSRVLENDDITIEPGHAIDANGQEVCLTRQDDAARSSPSLLRV